MENKVPPKTFHIFYAWAEGPWHGKALVSVMRKAGFIESSDSEATILIAHSVGSFLIKANKNNRIILLIGPPYWPGKSISRRLFKKVWLDFKSHQKSLIFWVQKMIWTTVYIVTKPSLTLEAWRAVHLKDPFVRVSDQAIIIQNSEDVFCSPLLATLIKNKAIILPGQHDDCWDNPGPYLELVEKLYSQQL